jgi:hypothetical protein
MHIVKLLHPLLFAVKVEVIIAPAKRVAPGAAETPLERHNMQRWIHHISPIVVRFSN